MCPPTPPLSICTPPYYIEVLRILFPSVGDAHHKVLLIDDQLRDSPNESSNEGVPVSCQQLFFDDHIEQCVILPIIILISDLLCVWINEFSLLLIFKLTFGLMYIQ
jgi:hypothetical protein